MCYSIYFPLFEKNTIAHRFEIEGTITRLNAMGIQLILRLLPPSNARDIVSHFVASVVDRFRHALQNLSDSDMVGITI